MKPHHDLRMLGSGPGILLFGLLVTTPCFGQVTPEAASAERWSWPRLRSVEEVDAGEISWLGKHVTAEEAVRLFSIVDSLSSPDAAQLLAGRFLQDPSYYYLQAIPETFERVEALVLDSLTSRHPEGDAGVVHVAYLLARIRWTIVQAYSRLPYYQYTFEGRQLDLDSPRVPENRITLDLDVSPATRLLEVLASPDATPHTAADYLASDVFAALIQHRSQSFYPVSVSLEVLALNLARAAGDEPLDRLYRYAFPVGLFHFAAVREHLDDYRTVVRT
ncbi:MAG: hypothetical protein ACREH6_01055, partial [Geminicoccaceae bacterium]